MSMKYSSSSSKMLPTEMSQPKVDALFSPPSIVSDHLIARLQMSIQRRNRSMSNVSSEMTRRSENGDGTTVDGTQIEDHASVLLSKKYPNIQPLLDKITRTISKGESFLNFWRAHQEQLAAAPEKTPRQRRLSVAGGWAASPSSANVRPTNGGRNSFFSRLVGGNLSNAPQCPVPEEKLHLICIRLANGLSKYLHVLACQPYRSASAVDHLSIGIGASRFIIAMYNHFCRLKPHNLSPPLILHRIGMFLRSFDTFSSNSAFRQALLHEGPLPTAHNSSLYSATTYANMPTAIRQLLWDCRDIAKRFLSCSTYASSRDFFFNSMVSGIMGLGNTSTLAAIDKSRELYLIHDLYHAITQEQKSPRRSPPSERPKTAPVTSSISSSAHAASRKTLSSATVRSTEEDSTPLWKRTMERRKKELERQMDDLHLDTDNLDSPGSRNLKWGVSPRSRARSSSLKTTPRSPLSPLTSKNRNPSTTRPYSALPSTPARSVVSHSLSGDSLPAFPLSSSSQSRKHREQKGQRDHRDQQLYHTPQRTPFASYRVGSAPVSMASTPRDFSPSLYTNPDLLETQPPHSRNEMNTSGFTSTPSSANFRTHSHYSQYRATERPFSASPYAHAEREARRLADRLKDAYRQQLPAPIEPESPSQYRYAKNYVSPYAQSRMRRNTTTPHDLMSTTSDYNEDGCAPPQPPPPTAMFGAMSHLSSTPLASTRTVVYTPSPSPPPDNSHMRMQNWTILSDRSTRHTSSASIASPPIASPPVPSAQNYPISPPSTQYNATPLTQRYSPWVPSPSSTSSHVPPSQFPSSTYQPFTVPSQVSTLTTSHAMSTTRTSSTTPSKSEVTALPTVVYHDSRAMAPPPMRTDAPEPASPVAAYRKTPKAAMAHFSPRPDLSATRATPAPTGSSSALSFSTVSYTVAPVNFNSPPLTSSVSPITTTFSTSGPLRITSSHSATSTTSTTSKISPIHSPISPLQSATSMIPLTSALTSYSSASIGMAKLDDPLALPPNPVTESSALSPLRVRSLSPTFATMSHNSHSPLSLERIHSPIVSNSTGSPAEKRVPVELALSAESSRSPLLTSILSSPSPIPVFSPVPRKDTPYRPPEFILPGTNTPLK